MGFVAWFIDRPTEAMDRIHRLGQHRPVQAIKLVIEDSIESRIIQVRVPYLIRRTLQNASLAPRKEICHGQCDVVHRRVGTCPLFRHRPVAKVHDRLWVA